MGSTAAALDRLHLVKQSGTLQSCHRGWDIRLMLPKLGENM